jgi:two-component system phosphate regulon sensor histidine kinase PhoR
VSHEIKTPISAVKAAVETLISDPDAPLEARQNFLGIIARQADRLDAIVEDLLSLTRIEQEQGRIADEAEPAEVAAVLQAAAETCAAKADAKSIRLTVEPTRLSVKMVPTLIEQAIINLVDNAIKYSPESTEVRITASRRGDEVVLSVVDQGRGIESEHLPRVFERFYRTDRARSRAMGGTGLGLSIVRHIAQTHGGRTTAQSQLGRGSTFNLHLPASGIHQTPTLIW